MSLIARWAGSPYVQHMQYCTILHSFWVKWIQCGLYYKSDGSILGQIGKQILPLMAAPCHQLWLSYMIYYTIHIVVMWWKNRKKKSVQYWIYQTCGPPVHLMIRHETQLFLSTVKVLQYIDTCGNEFKPLYIYIYIYIYNRIHTHFYTHTSEKTEDSSENDSWNK